MKAAKYHTTILTCVFIQTCRKTVECPCCHKTAIVSSTIMERDQKGKVQLYCTPHCVEQSRPPRHTLTGRSHDRNTYIYMLELTGICRTGITTKDKESMFDYVLIYMHVHILAGRLLNVTILRLGTPFPCSLCKIPAVPQYHLAMVDGTIRNFCSYDCVSIYRVRALERFI